MIFAALAVLIVAGAIYIVFGARSDSTASVTTPPTIVPITSTTQLPTTTSTSSTTTTVASRESGNPLYAVGNFTFTLTEPGKQLCAPHGATSGCVERSMPLYVFFPASRGAPGEVVSDAAPDRSAGIFPLVVFGNGYLETSASYSALLDYWASRGYVVAAPQFPLSQANSVGGPWEADILNQPGDLSAAISFMIGQDSSSSSSFYRLINTSEVAVVGQSDGADAALAVGYNTCCTDPRVKAVISLSGAELSSYPGKYFTSAGPPLLVVQGTDDDINVPEDSQAVFAGAHPPKYYLSLLGADHLEGYQGVNPYSNVVKRVTGAFLDSYLKGRSAALTEMSSAGNVPGVAQLS